MTAKYDPDGIRGRLRAVRLGRVYRLIQKLEVLDIAPLVAHADFLRALTDYDITLTSPSGLTDR